MSDTTWKDVTSAPEWSGLDPDQRSAVQQKFFTDVIQPNIPDGVNHDDVFGQFKARTDNSLLPTPSFGMQSARWVGRAGQAAASRTLDLGATLSKGLNPGAEVGAMVAGLPTPSDNARSVARDIAPAPAAPNDIAARSADFVGSLAPDMAAAIFSGGASEAPEALSLGARLIGGARSMALPSIENTRATYDQGVDAGLSPIDAAKRAGVAGTSTALMGALPASVAGGVAKRVVSGAAIGVGTSEAQRGAMNAVSPDGMQTGFDPVGDALSALAGGAFGGVLGSRKPLAHGSDLLTAHPDTPGPVVEDAASHEQTTAQPAVDETPLTARMIDPDARALSVHTQRVSDVADQLGLDPAQARAVTDHLAPSAPRDPVTNFYTSQELTPTLKAAQAHVEATGEPARYAEIDIRNLGGLNAAIGHTNADSILNELATTTHDELKNAGANVVPVRRGGDEFGYVVVGGDHEKVQAALDNAQTRADDTAREYGLADIAHPKGGPAGVGIVAAHEPIVPGQDLAEMFRNIDQKIESQKMGESQDGNAKIDPVGMGPTFARANSDAAADVESGSTRRASESARADVPEVPRQTSGEQVDQESEVAPLPVGVAIDRPNGNTIRVSGPAAKQYAPTLAGLGGRVGATLKDGQHFAFDASREADVRAALAPHAEAEQVQAAGMIPSVGDAVKAADKAIANRTTTGALHDMLMKVAPMAAGTDESRAVAKDFANEMRLARYEGESADKSLQRDLTHEQLKRMYVAADEQSVLTQKGESTAGRGLDTLSAPERAAVERAQSEATATFEEAKAAGMISGDTAQLPSYVPRMLVTMSEGAGARRFSTKDGAEAGAGRLRTSTANLLQRKHLTADETLAAAKAHDENAEIVQNIRTLPLATAKLKEAIAGRKLINAIQEIGKKTGGDTVAEGRDPSKANERWFTIPENPAFYTWKPKTVETEQGKATQFERVPMYIRGDFEGPLRAALGDGKNGAVYRGLMALKAKTMGLIMYSPIIHNAVEWGRALPAMPGKVLTFRAYIDGNRAKNDPAIMREAISAGLSPIGHGAFTDITSVAESPNVKPGRSWTSKVLAYVPGLFDKEAGESVKRAVDKMGDVWHNTLLWDRVADLQMGLYTGLRDKMLAKKMDPQTAQRIAAHMANRYAGTLPKEAMSSAAQKIANLTLFSRTFTLGNLGAMKDAVTGLPKDVQAQILRDAGAETLHGALSFAKKKARATLLLDIGLMYATNSLLQSSIAILAGDSTLDKEAKGYVRRLQAQMQKVKENPLELLNTPGAISSTADNEPGKQDRVLVGHAADGTAIYMRNPVGKIGEEFSGWLTTPLDMLKRKLSTFAQPAFQTLSNDKGYGRHVYDPNDDSSGANAKRLGRIAMLFVGAQLPVQALQGAADWYSGKGDATLNAARVLSPLAGVTFSKGAPGGEAIGEMYHAKDKHEFGVQEALPAIRDRIRAGDTPGAMKDMTALGIDPKLQMYYVKTTLDPSLRLSARAMQDFMRTATPEQAQRMRADIERRQAQ